MSSVEDFQRRIAAATAAPGDQLQAPRWFVGEWDHTWSWNEDGRTEVKCRVVIDVANEKLVAAQTLDYKSWSDATSDQRDDLAKSLFVENKVGDDPGAFYLVEIERLPTWASSAVGDPQLPPYEDDEVIGLDKDGCVVQWSRDNDMPVNSGESLDAFGLHNLSEHEIARVGVARESWAAAIAAQGWAQPEPAVAPVVARFRADGDFNAANQRMREVIEQQPPEVRATLQEAYAGLLEATEGVRDQFQADWRAAKASAQTQPESRGKKPDSGQAEAIGKANALLEHAGLPSYSALLHGVDVLGATGDRLSVTETGVMSMGRDTALVARDIALLARGILDSAGHERDQWSVDRTHPVVGQQEEKEPLSPPSPRMRV